MSQNVPPRPGTRLYQVHVSLSVNHLSVVYQFISSLPVYSSCVSFFVSHLSAYLFLIYQAYINLLVSNYLLVVCQVISRLSVIHFKTYDF